MVLLRSNQRHESVSLGRSASLGSLQDERNWKLENVDVSKQPPFISTANVTTTRNRRPSNPPSPHPSDYQFNPELDDYDDDLMEDSDSSDEREHAHASGHTVGHGPSAVAIPITRSPTSTSSTSSNSSMSHLNWRQKIQHVLHDRKHSLIGRALRRIFIGALLISVVTMCLGTVDPILKDAEALKVVYGVEAACLVVFTLELLLHIISAPTFRAIFNFSRLLDFLCVLPFYIDIIRAVATNRTLYETAYEIEGGAWVRILDLFRILRLFRVFPKSSKLRMMGTAFAHSIDGLWLLFYTIPLLIVLFSSLLFYAEQTESWFDENDRVWYYDIGVRSPFQSIPDCFWLVIVTLTTIG
ncbi:hypothetical protein SpCBS45565_g04493 [Spizellomyces sp. 'palustris']|nr:hypothetical protein SpCBS45565_g04493 [Spizellomyces sp. 'palustris']